MSYARHSVQIQVPAASALAYFKENTLKIVSRLVGEKFKITPASEQGKLIVMVYNIVMASMRCKTDSNANFISSHFNTGFDWEGFKDLSPSDQDNIFSTSQSAVRNCTTFFIETRVTENKTLGYLDEIKKFVFDKIGRTKASDEKDPKPKTAAEIQKKKEKRSRQKAKKQTSALASGADGVPADSSMESQQPTTPTPSISPQATFSLALQSTTPKSTLEDDKSDDSWEAVQAGFNAATQNIPWLTAMAQDFPPRPAASAPEAKKEQGIVKSASPTLKKS